MLRHAWFEKVDWEAMLRREVEAPWLPPPHGNLPREEFNGEAMNPPEAPYDRDTWEPLYKEFGPHRAMPWPEAWK